ncbi:MAG: hypothetical protein JXA14_13295, partial [Anaerolineae bacterium]|nr:hypothetical protein [Anaerolineae bacterium]
MRDPIDHRRQMTRRVPMWVILSLVVVLAVTISMTLFCAAGGWRGLPLLGWFQDDFEPLLIINTRTPAPSPDPTSTRPRIVVPTP